MAGLDSREDDERAEIELTYSILDDINQARPAFGRLAVCIIQVLSVVKSQPFQMRRVEESEPATTEVVAGAQR